MSGIFVPWLADAARSTGYRVVEIGGWRSRGHGAMRLVEGVGGHNTGTPDTAPGDYPSLNVVTNGRSDLAGPLCNLGLGRDGTIYVVAAGCAWHAGASAWAGFADLNDEFLGIEAESGGAGKWTAAQLDCYPKLVGALLKYMNRGTDRYAGHKDICLPKGRKVDPVGIDSAWMRSQAYKFMTGGGAAVSNVEEIVKAFETNFLPYSPDKKELVVLPVEVGASSTLVDALWVNLACAGDGGGHMDYEVWIGDDNGHMMQPGDGSHPAAGVVENNGRATFVIPSGARTFTLRHQETGDVRAGISIAYRSKA